MTDKQFRFQDLDVWKHAATFTPRLFAFADQLDLQRKYRFAEQLRAATLSITNNIAEGSGSQSDIDFANFLNTSRRSTFEVANILILLQNDCYLSPSDCALMLCELEEESKMLLGFIRNLRARAAV
jgi:four helix bundle protein